MGYFMLATIGECHVQWANHDLINLRAVGEGSNLYAAVQRDGPVCLFVAV